MKISKKGVIGFSDKVTNAVASINAQLLKEGRLCTNPYILRYHSYDSYDLTNDKTPNGSISRFTINGLNSIFPLIDIKLGENDDIIVEGVKLGNYTAFVDKEFKDHIEYIKEIMLDIFLMYEKDTDKIPQNLYGWYFED